MELEKIVALYHSKNPVIHGIFHKRLMAAIKLSEHILTSRKNVRALDIGCGEGKLLAILENQFPNVKTFGIDIEPNILQLKKFLNADIRVSPIEDTPFPDNFFDVAFSLDVLEHIKKLDTPIKEIRRILKPNGLLVVSSPTETWFYKFCRFLALGTTSQEKGPCSPHFHNAKSVEKFLLSHGLHVVEKICLPPLPPFILFTVTTLKQTKTTL